MVDRAARDETALLLRRFAVGRLTNFQFEDSLQLASKDRAIARVHREGVWPLYCDLREHRLAGKDQLTRPERREIAKYVLFLKSDREYEWPRHGPIAWLVLLVANLLTLGLVGHAYHRWYHRDPDRRAWPFRTAADLTQARERTPVYASGR